MTDTPPGFRAALSNRMIQMTLGGLTVIAAASLAAFGVQAVASDSADPDKARIEKIVRDYILEHPEIIPEAIERLRSKRMSDVISQNRSLIETPYGGAWEGAADADVVLVELFDYNCSFCRASLADLSRLLKEDKRLKVVYRELPVLSQESADAAKVSLLVAEKGQQPYLTFHKALYDAGKATRESIIAAAAKAGVDRKSTEAAITDKKYDAEIESNVVLAQRLQASGTPTFVIGDDVLNGAVGYEALKEAIAKARSKS